MGIMGKRVGEMGQGEGMEKWVKRWRPGGGDGDTASTLLFGLGNIYCLHL
jgi:hypothetical protein